MALLVLRAWSDLANGGLYSVLHPDGCATLIPIPETGELRATPCFLRADMLLSPCTGKPIASYNSGRYMLLHNDPRLDAGFYTDYYAPGGRIPRKLSGGDVLLFAAGLRLERCGKGRSCRGVYIVGGILVREVVNIAAVGWREALERHPELSLSPHYWRHDDRPVAVTGEGFTITPPLRVDDGDGGPSEALGELLGWEAARAFARGRFRRSRLVEGDIDLVERVAASWGSKLATPQPWRCKGEE